MEFDATEEPSTKEAEPKSRTGFRIAIVATIVIVGMIIAFSAYWFFLKPSGTPWLFEGAYAKYEGSTTVLSISFDLGIRLEVVDYNSTHAKLLTYMEMESDLGGPIEWQNTTWASLDDMSYKIEDCTLESSHEDHVYVEGLGTRVCTVYEYSSANDTISFYVDNETEWPLKIIFSMTSEGIEVSFTLNLTETNIPELEA